MNYTGLFAIALVALLLWMVSLELRHRSLVQDVKDEFKAVRADAVSRFNIAKAKIENGVAELRKKLP